MYARRPDRAGAVPRRLHAGPVPIALAALLLSACGSGGDDEPTAGASASSSVPAPTGTSGVPTPAADSPAAEEAAEETPDVDVDAVQTDEPADEESVVVTYAEWASGSGAIEAGAFVQGVVESGGTCTLSATRGGSEETGEPVPAEAGPSTTDCGALSVALPGGSSGTWDVTVTYESDGTDVASDAIEVRVP